MVEPGRCEQLFLRIYGNDRCPSYSHRQSGSGTSIPRSDVRRVVPSLAASPLLGDQPLDRSSFPFPGQFRRSRPLMQTDGIHTGPHGRCRVRLFEVGDIPNLKRNDIGTMALWADHPFALILVLKGRYHSEYRAGIRNLPRKGEWRIGVRRCVSVVLMGNRVTAGKAAIVPRHIAVLAAL